MRFPARLLAVAAALTLVTGCSGTGPRSPGTPVTEAEAEVLAELLQRNHRAGGADFVATVPYGESVVLTLTGELDLRSSVGRARAATSFGDGTTDDVRTLVFTPEDLWFGDVPGLAEALDTAGLPPASFVHRPVVTADGEAAGLVDVLVTVLLNLASPTADDPQAFLGGDYTWEGQRSVDSRLTSLFGLRAGRTVAVAAADDRLVQYVTPLDGDLELTVTLTGHGPRTVQVPAGDDTAEVAHVPEIAAELGG